MIVNAIAAVGLQGQLGMNGKMPWPKDSEDLEFFRSMTEGNVVVFGAVTFDNLFESQPVWSNRLVLRMDREKTGIYDQGKLLAYWSPGVIPILNNLHEKVNSLWVAGGATIFDLWNPYIRRFYLTQIQYSGVADSWMPAMYTGPRRIV